jgi:hypothetical protein
MTSVAPGIGKRVVSTMTPEIEPLGWLAATTRAATKRLAITGPSLIRIPILYQGTDFGAQKPNVEEYRRMQAEVHEAVTQEQTIKIK